MITTAATAADLKAGDCVPVEYFDAAGMAACETATVESVRAFTRKVRVTYAGGWGVHTYPLAHRVAIVS